ncbi:right-handed parallel beta-helix repeat-containing protein [Tropicimonas marinistellae]|uniref:right-handed parallel beta-helix repeat-containing protein n=1 Tax=Tropicimonas marinistellae TaxID=1739787 RepID=UPI00082C53F3|nr:right-handed parallel beta-helix repeat-containing protein [Tropicimonas marinistellae]
MSAVMVLFATAQASCTATGTGASTETKTGTEIRVTMAEGARGLKQAVSTARPGDVILLEPGQYVFSGDEAVGLALSNSGRQNASITLRGDGGNAILNCGEMSREAGVTCLQITGDWWNLEKLGVTRARQNAQGAWSIGIHLEGASHNRLTDVESFANEGPGILVTGRSASNLIEQCTSHDNYDPLATPPGGNADGIQLAYLTTDAVGNVVSNCKSFSNSDDGFDLWEAEAPVTIHNSEATRNGYVPGTSNPAGDGNGFKLGRNKTGPAHFIVQNVASNNRYHGFVANQASLPAIMRDNQSFGNGVPN